MQYSVTFPFKIENISLLVSKNGRWGADFNTLVREFSDDIEYTNDLGDIVSFQIFWEKSNIKKRKDSYYEISSIEGIFHINFPKELGTNYDAWKFDAYFQCFLQLLFFILNVHLLGSIEVVNCHYSSGPISLKNHQDGKLYLIDDRFRLDGTINNYLDDRFHNIFNQNIFNFNTPLSIKRIIVWTTHINPWFNQLTEKGNRLHVAIFGLLELFFDKTIADNRFMEVILLAKTVEGLFDSPHDSIGRVLIDRIQSLTLLKGEKLRLFKKTFQEFYNIRSRIIHGEFISANPVHFDNFFDDTNGMGYIWNKIDSDMIIKMYSLIFFSFRRIIIRNIYKIEFREILISK